MDERDKTMIEAAKMILPEGYIIVPAAPLPARRWPFVEKPGEFTERLGNYCGGPGGGLAGVRTVLIEDPPALSPDYLFLIKL